MNIKDEIKSGIACNSVHKPDSVLGRVACLSVHPGKMILYPFVRWFEKRYKGKHKFARLVFSFDLILLGALIALVATAAFLVLSKTETFEDKIIFEASVAPETIVSGAQSTLVIRFTNNTKEELKDVKLAFEFPKHFLLQEILYGDSAINTDAIVLSNIAIGDSRSMHIKGVMFGDVGGEQKFTSHLYFAHGDKQTVFGEKTDEYIFSPSSSTLEMSLELPQRLMAHQPITGKITYKNTGPTDFPIITIKPEWPDGFTFQTSDAKLINNSFQVPAITAGSEGVVNFAGYLADVSGEVTFIFHPSFTFGSDSYKQNTLSHTAPIVPPQIRVEHSVEKTSVQPGASAMFTVRYENIGDEEVKNLILGIETDSPFFVKNAYRSEPIPTVARGEVGEVRIAIPMRSSIRQSETDQYENLDLSTWSTATYSIGDIETQTINTKGSKIISPITSPIVLESFGRYSSPSGDQLGRGPIPPKVGLETKYWIFWHIDGTTNRLENVRVEGTLADNVVFTGRQTSSQNSGVVFNNESREIVWEAEAIEPTLSPSSKIVGVAFELGITPDQSMVGMSPLLISQVRLTAIDGRTGAFISASGNPVSILLPDDVMASGKGLIEQ